MKISMFEIVGDFGEDKDAAAYLRETAIKPCVMNKERVSIDFDGVTLVTQSFIHALVSDVLRISGEKVLDLLEFRNCADVVRGIISTVVQYSLETSDDPMLVPEFQEKTVSRRAKKASGNGRPARKIKPRARKR